MNWNNTRTALTFAYIALTFMIMAAASIYVNVGHLDTIEARHRVPTATWRAVIINCCGHNSCLKERHHEVIQFEYKTTYEE